MMIGLKYNENDNDSHLGSSCTESIFPNHHGCQSIVYRGALRLMPYPQGALALA